MKKLLVLSVVIVLAVSASADRITVTPTGVTDVTDLGTRAEDNMVLDARVANGYYTGFDAEDIYKGGLYTTTQTEAWDMNAFHIGVYVPAAGSHTFTIEFWDDPDGNFPYPTAPVTVLGTYDVEFDTDDAGGYTLQVDIDPLTIPGQNVWMAYANPGLDYGVLHVDPATVGFNQHDNGWYQLDDLGEHWYWYGGDPYADLYAGFNMVPEPASLLLIGLGALLLRRR